MWCNPRLNRIGPLLFIIYINDLFLRTSLLDPIMFADDKNLFYSYQGINSGCEV